MSSACVLLALACCQACVHLPNDARGRPLISEEVLWLNGYPLTVHLAGAGLTGPLLVYVTGDGGWRGKDLDVFRKLVSWKYAAAGFSAPEYIRHLRGDEATTTPQQLANDYVEIIETAKRTLQLPERTPVILVGVSRGAGLSVAAAGYQVLQPGLAGIVAIALTKEEEHVRLLRRITQAPSDARVPVMLQIYEYLPRLGTLPLSVIQSTRDSYLPAEQARALFGADTDRRQFHAIDARNHSFGGARDALYQTVQESLSWIGHLRAAD